MLNDIYFRYKVFIHIFISLLFVFMASLLPLIFLEETKSGFLPNILVYALSFLFTMFISFLLEEKNKRIITNLKNILVLVFINIIVCFLLRSVIILLEENALKNKKIDELINTDIKCIEGILYSTKIMNNELMIEKVFLIDNTTGIKEEMTCNNK